MTKIAVMGAGSWGTTFAKVLADAQNEVILWARREDVVEDINDHHRNGDYLPGIDLPESLTATIDPEAAMAGVEQVYIAVPSSRLRENLEAWGQFIPKDAIVVSLMKGVEQ
jgi:glycerol-3-phosphate dehydrogenase (NAD(P)+)